MAGQLARFWHRMVGVMAQRLLAISNVYAALSKRPGDTADWLAQYYYNEHCKARDRDGD